MQTHGLGGPALRNDHVDSFVVLVDAQLLDGPAASAALFNNGYLYVRDVRTSGYSAVIEDRAAGVINQPNISEWHYGVAEGLFDQNVRHSLGLPIQDAPDPARDDPSLWVNVADFGALPDDFNNDANNVQNAIHSMAPGGPNEGKRTLYFPPGRYVFDNGVTITADVERIVGCFASVQPRNAAISTQPVWRIVVVVHS
ncbi:MAG: glycoside hydrolase family 55 protein [Verrucomicrobia bacterium]|nr:glycoside hydrolase family 55 protein [Verrucomicrobiota bacterium]